MERTTISRDNKTKKTRFIKIKRKEDIQSYGYRKINWTRAIKKQNGGVNASFTVRKISYGVGVEKTFLVHSPLVEKVEVVRVGKARRAKLYYLRDRVGKAAKTKENTGARIENKEITVKEELAEEVPVEAAPEEAPAVETETPVVEEVTDTVSEEKVDEVKE